jgi:hypothetical protein
VIFFGIDLMSRFHTAFRQMPIRRAPLRRQSRHFSCLMLSRLCYTISPPAPRCLATLLIQLHFVISLMPLLSAVYAALFAYLVLQLFTHTALSFAFHEDADAAAYSAFSEGQPSRQLSNSRQAVATPSPGRHFREGQDSRDSLSSLPPILPPTDAAGGRRRFRDFHAMVIAADSRVSR